MGGDGRGRGERRKRRERGSEGNRRDGKGREGESCAPILKFLDPPLLMSSVC